MEGDAGEQRPLDRARLGGVPLAHGIFEQPDRFKAERREAALRRTPEPLGVFACEVMCGLSFAGESVGRKGGVFQLLEPLESVSGVSIAVVPITV